jgi:hypothetical protein
VKKSYEIWQNLLRKAVAPKRPDLPLMKISKKVEPPKTPGLKF